MNKDISILILHDESVYRTRSDVRFITKLKKYIEGQISGKLQVELAEITHMIEIVWLE